MPAYGPPPQASLVATETGYHASYEGTGAGFFVCLCALLLGGFLCTFVYLEAVDSSSRAAFPVIFFSALLAPFAALFIYMGKEFTAVVDFTPTRITKKTIFGSASMNWTDVASVSFAPRSYAIVLHGKSGQTLRLPRLAGCEADLEQCVRRYLPEIDF